MKVYTNKVFILVPIIKDGTTEGREIPGNRAIFSSFVIGKSK